MHPAVRASSPALLVATSMLLSACSTESAVDRQPHKGSATASTVDGVQQITVRVGDTYRFDPSTITVHQGKVRVLLVNDGKGAPHNWTLLGFPAAFVPNASAGARTTATFVTPSPGTYTFVCTIHQKQGQTGKLVVLPD